MIRAITAAPTSAIFKDGRVVDFIQVFGQDEDTGDIFYWVKSKGTWLKYETTAKQKAFAAALEANVATEDETNA